MLYFPVSVLRAHLTSFLTLVNHLLYFYTEDDIENKFPAASTIVVESVNYDTELCIVLAIGAKLQRPQDLEVSTLCCTYGTIGLQHFEYTKSVWLLRALALLSVYHMDEDMELSSQYLSLYTMLMCSLVQF